MIVLVLGQIGVSRKTLALVRDTIATYEAPAAYIDAIEGFRFDPVSAMKLETGDLVLARLDKLVTMLWEDGARRIVVPVPAAAAAGGEGGGGAGRGEPDLSRLAFWLKRAAKQPVYKLDVDAYLREKSIGTWSPDVLEISVRQQAKALGPRQEIKPWEPSPPCYHTERLTLTWPSPAQIDGYYQAIVGTDIFRTLIWNGPTGPDDLHDYWLARKQIHERGRRSGREGDELNVAIVEKATGDMIGGASLRPHRPRGEDHGVFDIGYVLAKRWHGRGYATEMTRALVDAAFRERGGERVYADVFVGNTASKRVLEKNGFEYEGLARSVVAKPDGRRDEWRMGIARAGWEKRQQAAS